MVGSVRSVKETDLESVELQPSFPVISMHTHAKCITQNIPVAPYDDIHRLRQLLNAAKTVLMFTDGSIPAAGRDDQAPAFAIFIFSKTSMPLSTFSAILHHSFLFLASSFSLTS